MYNPGLRRPQFSSLVEPPIAWNTMILRCGCCHRDGRKIVAGLYVASVIVGFLVSLAAETPRRITFDSVHMVGNTQDIDALCLSDRGRRMRSPRALMKYGRGRQNSNFVHRSCLEDMRTSPPRTCIMTIGPTLAHSTTLRYSGTMLTASESLGATQGGGSNSVCFASPGKVLLHLV